jgi:hypothetical protein
MPHKLWSQISCLGSSDKRRSNSRPHHDKLQGYPILIQYCRHVARSRLIEEKIRAFELEWTSAAGGLERWNLLLQMAQRETKFVLDCARMLRLGPHQQIGPRTAGHTRSREIAS